MSQESSELLELSDAFALFIGDALLSCDNKDANELVAPFRFNKSLNLSDIQHKLDSYRTLIDFMASQTKKEYYLRATKKGFDVVFPLPKDTKALDYLLRMAKEVEISSDSVKESFLTGVYDGRGYIDGTERIGSIVVDLPKENNLEDTVYKCVTHVGESLGYKFRRKNPKRKRKGEARLAQLRLTTSSAKKYISELGFYSPKSIIKILGIDELTNRAAIKKDESLTVSPIVFVSGAVPRGDVQELLAQMIQNVQLAETAEEANYLDRVSSVDQSRDIVGVEDLPRPRAKKQITPSGRAAYSRDVNTAVRALKAAKHKCERIECCRELFVRSKDEMPYLEPHHLVPLACNDFFDNTLDVEANIVALCSSCHNEIHYGKNRSVLIEELYNTRIERLSNAGIELSLQQLLDYYGANEV